jgi:hypothetical protein
MINKILFTIALIFIVSQASFGQCKDTVQQRAAFSKLSSVEKAAPWREHLLNELDKRPMNKVQRDLVQFALDNLLNVELYEGKYDKKVWDRFRRDIRANFSLKEGSEVFEQLPSYKTIRIDSLAQQCSCSTWWTFCYEGECSRTCGICYNCTRNLSCGPFWGFECDGKCSPY